MYDNYEAPQEPQAKMHINLFFCYLLLCYMYDILLHQNIYHANVYDIGLWQRREQKAYPQQMSYLEL